MQKRIKLLITCMLILPICSFGQSSTEDVKSSANQVTEQVLENIDWKLVKADIKKGIATYDIIEHQDIEAVLNQEMQKTLESKNSSPTLSRDAMMDEVRASVTAKLYDEIDKIRRTSK